MILRRFIGRGRSNQQLELHVREQRGIGAGMPFVLQRDPECRIELTLHDLEWLRAVSPRAIETARKAGRC